MQGNLNNHKGGGHKSRGIHKGASIFKNGGVPRVGQGRGSILSEKARKEGWMNRNCPYCGLPIPVKRFVSQKKFRAHVRECKGL